MAKLGIPTNLIYIYDDFLSDYVQWDQYSSEEFDIPVVCIQYSPTGPNLFNLPIDGIYEYFQMGM